MRDRQREGVRTQRARGKEKGRRERKDRERKRKRHEVGRAVIYTERDALRAHVYNAFHTSSVRTRQSALYRKKQEDSRKVRTTATRTIAVHQSNRGRRRGMAACDTKKKKKREKEEGTGITVLPSTRRLYWFFVL